MTRIRTLRYSIKQTKKLMAVSHLPLCECCSWVLFFRISSCMCVPWEGYAPINSYINPLLPFIYDMQQSAWDSTQSSTALPSQQGCHMSPRATVLSHTFCIISFYSVMFSHTWCLETLLKNRDYFSVQMSSMILHCAQTGKWNQLLIYLSDGEQVTCMSRTSF